MHRRNADIRRKNDVSTAIDQLQVAVNVEDDAFGRIATDAVNRKAAEKTIGRLRREQRERKPDESGEGDRAFHRRLAFGAVRKSPHIWGSFVVATDL